jgi:hypothetical protein
MNPLAGNTPVSHDSCIGHPIFLFEKVGIARLEQILNIKSFVSHDCVAWFCLS